MPGLRHALRSLSRSPAFTITVVASIGLTVGLACSVFAVVNATWFGRLPYPDSDRLLELWQTSSPGSSQVQDYLQPNRMIDWLEVEPRHLEAIAGSGMGPTLIVSDAETPQRVESAPVIGDWFTVMGVPPARGRLLTDEDRDPGAERALVVSQRFARNQDVDVGSTVELSGIRYTVVGVMPAEFEARPRVWMTVESLPQTLQPAAYAGVARIRVGSSLEEAVLEVEQMAAAQVAADSARYAGLGATARTFGEMARSPSRPRLWLLVGVTGAVILIGMSNLTQLFLVRARRHRRELAVRAALGGGVWQIGRPLAVEAAMLTSIGLLVGLGISVYGTGIVQALLGGEYALPSDASLGLPVVVFGLVLTLLLAAFVGGEPLRHLGSLDIQGLLQHRAAGAVTTPAERRAQRVLVAAQVATCVVLAAVALVLGSAYAALGDLDVGYDAGNVVQAVVDYEMAGVDEPEQWELARRVAERLSVHPAVSAVGVWQLVGQAYPPRPGSNAVTDGAPVALGTFERLYRYYQVEPGFFDALGIDVVAGRAFTSADGPGQAPVAVVTQPGAAAWWPGESPLGRQIKIGEQGTWMTIVGVVEHVQDLDALGRTIALNGQRMPLLFVPARQLPTAPPGWGVNARGGVMIGARPARSYEAAAEALRAEITTAAPTLPVTAVGTMQRLQLTRGYSGRWLALNGKLAGTGVAVALLLALLGIVGVVLEGLGRRTREIGLRMALGARARAVVAMSARESSTVALAGVALGLGGLFVLDGLLSRVVLGWEVQRLALGVLHPGVLAIAATAVTLIACATSVIAAGRAAGIDPAVALRSE